MAWASSTLAFITAAMFPIPILFYYYGAKIAGPADNHTVANYTYEVASQSAQYDPAYANPLANRGLNFELV